MKLNEKPRDILTNTNQSTGFQIETNALMFQMLSSGIYENKIKAVIRELACNAYDSHMMLGEPDKQFSIHLPNAFEPWLEVRDFGVGLSEDQIYNLYTVYGRSDKRDSNDVIGGLGIGSKSPFSYTDQFTVESIYDGVKTVYNAFVGTDGAPQITKVMSRKTDEHNGVAVKIPVKKEDFHHLYNEAKEVFKWFKVVPEITGYEINVESVVKDEDWFTIPSSGWGGKSYVIMGNVAYTVDVNYSMYPLLNAIKSSKSMVFRFNIGDLSVAASRETLSFDKMTTENFNKKLEQFEKEALDKIQERLDNAENLHREEFEDISNIMSQYVTTLKFKGKTLDSYTINEGDLKDISVKKLESSYRGVNIKCQAFAFHKLSPWAVLEFKVLVDDSSKYRQYNFNTFYMENHGTTRLCIEPSKVNEFEKTFKNFKYSIEYMSDRVANGCKPERKPRGQSVSGINFRVLEDGKLTGVEKMTKKDLKEWVNDQSDTVYVKSVDYRSGQANSIIDSVSDIVTDCVVIFVNENAAKELIEKTSAVDFSEYSLDDDTLTKYNNFHKYHSCRAFFSSWNIDYQDHHKEIVDLMEYCDNTLINKAFEYSKVDCCTPQQSLMIQAVFKLKEPKSVIDANEIAKSWENMLTDIRGNYKLLSWNVISSSSGRKELTEEIKEYILMKNEKIKQEETNESSRIAC